jgi:alkanesulfonate monooxygenase SsuD/methylene tetrahydromethanopterin reductase-like flavin-dependent oxidoreductase (luciferase family)
MTIDIAAVLAEIDSIGNEHSPRLEEFLEATRDKRQEIRDDPDRVRGVAALCATLRLDEGEVMEVSETAAGHMANTGAVFAAAEGAIDPRSLLKAMFVRAFFAGIRYQEKRDEDEPTS